MGFYDYADYNRLPPDQKVIWWLDEYITYDLVFFFTLLDIFSPPFVRQASYSILVQRYTLYNYAWAEDYSTHLFNLLDTTCAGQMFYGSAGDYEFLSAYRQRYPSSTPSSEVLNGEVTITINGIQEGQRVVVSYLHPAGKNKGISQHLDKVNNVWWVSDPIVLQKHFLFYTSKDNGTTKTVSMAKHSAVITGSGVTIPSDYLYDTIGSMSTGHLPPVHPLFIQDSNRTENDINVVAVSNYNELHLTKLIVAKPPSNLFNGLFNSQQATQGNKKGGGISDADLIGLSRLNMQYEAVLEDRGVYLPSIGGPISWLYINTEDNFKVVTNINEDISYKLSLIPKYTYAEADLMFKLLLAQTALITPTTSNWEKIPNTNSNGDFLDKDGNVTTNPEEYYYKDNPDYIEEYVMGSELMIQEIHACLGAGEFAYYMDGGDPQPYYMNIARKLDWFAKAYGVAFNPDGSIISVRGRKNVPYTGGSATIPDGYARGQYADRTNEEGKETMGIAYQNRCNIYENLTDDNSGNDVLKNGDIVLCENFLQLFESYLEDLDKGLNWQEMGGGLVPNADGTSYTTFEGMGTLLAEVAYTLSALSSNIQQTHVLALKNNAIIMEVLKGLGLPVGVGTLPVGIGGESGAGGGGTATVVFPQLSANAVSLHKRIMDVLATVSLMAGSSLGTVEEENNGI